MGVAWDHEIYANRPSRIGPRHIVGCVECTVESCIDFSRVSRAHPSRSHTFSLASQFNAALTRSLFSLSIDSFSADTPCRHEFRINSPTPIFNLILFHHFFPTISSVHSFFFLLFTFYFSLFHISKLHLNLQHFVLLFFSFLSFFIGFIQ